MERRSDDLTENNFNAQCLLLLLLECSIQLYVKSIFCVCVLRLWDWFCSRQIVECSSNRAYLPTYIYIILLLENNFFHITYHHQTNILIVVVYVLVHAVLFFWLFIIFFWVHSWVRKKNYSTLSIWIMLLMMMKKSYKRRVTKLLTVENTSCTRIFLYNAKTVRTNRFSLCKIFVYQCLVGSLKI